MDPDKTELIRLLGKVPGQWHSLRSIQTQTGLTTGMILDQIERLRKSGYWIELSPALGYRLHPHSSGLSHDRIQSGLKTQRLGRRLLIYRETDSTNDTAWSYAGELAYERSDYDGLAVFADHQRAGRGRLGRGWFSQPGAGLMGSFLVYCDQGQGVNLASLSIVAGLCAAEAIDRVCRLDTQIKWPNDVLWQQMKLAGAMVESRQIGRHRAYVIGIGINCSIENHQFPAELVGRAVSLQQITGQPVDRNQLARELIRSLDHRLTGLTGSPESHRQTIEVLHATWAAKCVNTGHPLTVVWNGREYHGRVVDVDVEQGLLMRLDSGGVRLFDAATTTVKPD